MKLWLVINGADYGWSGRVREIYQHTSEKSAFKRILWLVRYHIGDELQTDFDESQFDLDDIQAIRNDLAVWEKENYTAHNKNIHLVVIDTDAPNATEYSPENKNGPQFMGNLDLIYRD